MHCRVSTCLLALLIASVAVASAIAQPGAADGAMSASGTAAAQAADTSVIGAESAADTAISARDYIAQVRAAFTPESRRYSSIRTVLALVDPLYAVVVGLLILFTGLSARMRDVARRFTTRSYIHTLVYLAQYAIVVFLLSFPLAYFSGYALEHAYHLSNQNLLQWLADQGKDVAVSVVMFGVIPLTWLAYRAIRASRRWWLWLGLGSIPVIVMLVLVQPVLIDPLYNKFQPLEDKVLEEKILALAEKTGIPGRHVYQVDKSAQTKKLNAYVNGFGVSQRVVFWDTILKAMNHDELQFVAGHEMGHYVLGHMWKFIVFVSVLSFAVFFFVGRLAGAAMRRFGPRWGFTELHDIASLPLLMVALTIVTFVAQPLFLAYSRYQEHQADVFALEVTHLNEAGATAFLKLGEQNKANPEPSALETWLLWTHPPEIERVRFMLEYKPWEEGEPNQLFKPKRSS